MTLYEEMNRRETEREREVVFQSDMRETLEAKIWYGGDKFSYTVTVSSK